VTEPSRRWEGDDRGAGVGDARAFRPGLDLSAGTLDEPGWVAEDAEMHLLPHINRACERSRRLRVVDAQSDGSVKPEGLLDELGGARVLYAGRWFVAVVSP
jgi:hypothetical protein